MIARTHVFVGEWTPPNSEQPPRAGEPEPFPRRGRPERVDEK